MTYPLNAADAILAKGLEAHMRERPALIHAGGATTFGQLAALVEHAGAALAQLGVQRGERVALLMKDSPLFCATFLAAMKIGAVAIALNTRLPASDLAFIVADSEAKLLIADEEFLAAASTTNAKVVPVQAFAAAAHAAPGGTPSAATRADEPAFWLYSSGTTGRPKAIIHSHFNAAHAGKLLREVVDLDEGMVVLCTSKLFFAFALDNAFLGPLSLGAATVLNEGWPEPDAIVEQVERYRPSAFFTVPTFFRRLLTLGRERLAPFARIAVNVTGGERLPDAIFNQWRDTVGTEILVAYGMSETFCNALSNRRGDNRPGSCGKPLGDVEARLLDADGHEVGAGEPGVLWVKHPSLALRYKNEESTARAFDQGWFCTGDLFTRDADGYWHHQGRADELYKVAGQWVKPADVEEAVLADKRVRDAACVVVPDRDGFDRLALFVVGDDAESAARERCAAALPRHSQPKWIRAIDELPRTATGKVQRFVLRRELMEELLQ